MTQKLSYYPLGGGLDLVTPAISVAPGRARAALNYEADATGYRRIQGYERYDGRTSPTDAFAAASTETQGALDRDAARAAITAVPGSGPVRGVWVYNGKVYAWRDNALATAGVMWRASTTGWVQVSDAFPAGGRYELLNYNFFGATNLYRMYGVNGVGKAFQFDGTTLTFITSGMTVDTPARIAVHARHLFLSFPGGSLQHSATGDPLTWTPRLGAGELAIGDEITDLISNTAASLVVLGRNSVNILYGTSTNDWRMETLSDEAGALAWSAEKIGTPLYMDNRGVRSLTATQSFGNFSIGTLTYPVATLIRTKLRTGVVPVASVRVRTRDTYRLFFSDNSAISIYMGKKVPEIMVLDFGRAVTCACSVEEGGAGELILFGSDNGMVYRMDYGRSFDGQPVLFYLRLPFNHMGGPHTLKRWHRAVVEFNAPVGAIELRVSGEVDYGDPSEPSMEQQFFRSTGGGGFWDTVNWDQFYWSSAVEGTAEAYLDGVGNNMSLLIGGEAGDEDPHLLQGLTLFYTDRGQVR